jgi:hypothetical protein
MWGIESEMSGLLDNNQISVDPGVKFQYSPPRPSQCEFRKAYAFTGLLLP